MLLIYTISAYSAYKLLSCPIWIDHNSVMCIWMNLPFSFKSDQLNYKPYLIKTFSLSFKLYKLTLYKTIFGNQLLYFKGTRLGPVCHGCVTLYPFIYTLRILCPVLPLVKRTVWSLRLPPFCSRLGSSLKWQLSRYRVTLRACRLPSTW